MITKTRVFLVLAILGIAYAGLKGYLYFKTKDHIDKMAAAAAPFADIEYGSVSSTLGGAIEVGDIVIKPHAYDDTVKIEQIRIQTPGLGFLLNGQDAVRSGELPEHLSISFQEIRLALDGSLVRTLEEMEASQTSNRSSTEDPVCTLNRTSTTAQYRQLGVEDMVFDTALSIERGDTSNEMRLTVNYTLHGIEEGRVAVTLGGVGGSIHSARASIPRLVGMQARFNPDPAFIDNMLEYCAEKNNTDIPAFVDQLFDKSDDYYAAELGFIPGPGIRDGLKQLIKTRGELRIYAEPLSPLDLSTVHLYEPKDWPGLFGISAFVNESPITDFSFRVPEQGADKDNTGKSLFDFSEAPSNEKKEESAPDKKPSPPADRQRSEKPSDGYRAIDKDNIRNFIDERAEIVTHEGKSRSGTILKVEDGVIYLKQYFSNGSFSTRVSLEDVQHIKVAQ